MAIRGHDVAKRCPQAPRRPEPSARIEDYRADLPADLVAVIEKAMDPDPARRFRTAGAMLHALDLGVRPDRGLGAVLARVLENVGPRPAPDREESAVRKRRRMPFMAWAFDAALRLLMVLMGLWVAAWMVRQIFRQLFPH